MARLICALLALLPLAGQTSIEVATVSKTDIQRNLEAFEDSNFKREQKVHSMSAAFKGTINVDIRDCGARTKGDAR